MTSFYTKTALKKMKKPDLVDLYLDLQAELLDANEYGDLKAYQDVEAEIIKDHSEIGSITEVNDTIKKLKEQIKKMQKLQREVKMWENAVDV